MFVTIKEAALLFDVSQQTIRKKILPFTKKLKSGLKSLDDEKIKVIKRGKKEIYKISVEWLEEVFDRSVNSSVNTKEFDKSEKVINTLEENLKDARGEIETLREQLRVKDEQIERSQLSNQVLISQNAKYIQESRKKGFFSKLFNRSKNLLGNGN